MKVGNRIKELRNKRGLTQEALAAALGVTPQSVSKWECEVNFPDVSLLPDIAVFFGVSIDSLFSMTRADEFERIGNRINEAGIISDDEVKQIEAMLTEQSDGREDRAAAEALLAKLYNHQASEYRKKAALCAKAALEISESDTLALKELSRSSGGAPHGVIDGSHRELIAYLKGLLARDPENTDAAAMLIDNLIADTRIDEAAMWCDHLEKTDDSYRPLVYKYSVAEARGDGEKALAALAVLTAVYSADVGALVAAADIYFRRGEYEKAIGNLLKATELSPAPKPVEYTVSAAHIAELLGNLDDSVVMLREALRILKEEWGIVTGERVDALRREIKRITTQE